MNDYLQFILVIIGSYLLGSIPSSVWVGRWFFAMDIREFGSGNAGATNTVRILGYKAGIPVLLFDIAKGWFPVFLVGTLLNWDLLSDKVIYLQIIAGLAAVIGHVYPIYIGFRGGKGVGTLAGMALGLFPLAFLSSLLVFVLIIVFTKYVSLGSMLAAISFPLFLIFVFNTKSWPLIILGVLASFFIIYTHRRNIKSLLDGTENKFSVKKKKANKNFN